MASSQGSPPRRKLGLLTLVLCSLSSFWVPLNGADLFDSEGPHFLSEPSRLNYFTNVQGLSLHCTSRGSPAPRPHWLNQKTGQPVDAIPGVREFFPNGTMHFPPFAVAYYRPDIHDQVYVCVAENAVGKVRSRDVQVRAVINEQFDVRVESAYTSQGNDALLRCVIPEPVKAFVSVTSWVKDSTLNIFPPHSGGGGRYFMAPSGELLIEGVGRNDSMSSFRCRTVNRLTDETQLSESSAGLQLKEGKGVPTAPRIVSRAARVRLKEGDVGVIFCLSEGQPPPSQTWHKVQSSGELEPLRSSERVRLRQSAVILETVIASDSGAYVCVANNTSGSDRYTVQVEVSKALEVQMVPNILRVDIGKMAELTCWTNRAFNTPSYSSAPTRDPTATVQWRKDGVEIRPNLRISINPTGDTLKIASVQREDKGMYQCFIKSDSDMAQASAELRLGDSHPQLIYRFIEQTLRSGAAVSIKCSATGNPPPHITWLLDGFSLPHSDRLLIGQYVTTNGDVVSHVNITATQVEDGGEFQCTATNKLGAISHSARLNIYGTPFVRQMPSTVTAVAGKAFHIKCPVAGYPITGITWSKEDVQLPSNIRQSVSPNGTLTIKDVDRSVDSGWYTCAAANKQGHSNRRGVHISVVVPPKLNPFSFREGLLENESVLATCGVSDGDPPVRLEWFKDAVAITDNTSTAEVNVRFVSDLGAVALKIPRVSWKDTGNYSCVAQNAAGQASLTQALVVHVPPRIAPYTFPSPVLEGSRVQVVCSVEQSDIESTNLTVTWLKDGDPLLPPTGSRPLSPLWSNAKVVQVDAYSAILIIDRVVSERDSGNYTCQISNSVEEVHKTNELVVRVPPKWVNEPRDREVTEGKGLVIPCEARGFPFPKLSWKKAMDDRRENYRDIPIAPSVPAHSFHNSLHQEGLSTSSMGSEPTFYANGTLVIPAVRKSHHGSYLCEAANGIGSGLSKVIRLTVNAPIRIREPPQNVSASVGGSAVLRCEVTGDPPILVGGWRKGREDIKPDGRESRYRVRWRNATGESGALNGVRSDGSKNVTTIAVMELTVTNVERHDTGRYLCYAGNQHGESQAVIGLFVQEPPDVPRNLHVVAKGSRFVRLGWTLSQSSSTHLTQFLVKYHTVAPPRTPQQISVGGSLFSEMIRDLRPATAYAFTIVAENDVGQSDSSELLEVKTDGESPEGKVRMVQLIAVSSTDIQVSWENPEKDTWHGQLLGYYVGYRKVREGDQYQFVTVERKEQSLQEFLVGGLTPYTSYEVIIQAYNSLGPGPTSEAVTVTTLEDVPVSAPEGAKCVALTSDSLQLTWNPLSGEGARGVVTGYRVTLEQVESDSVLGADMEGFPVVRRTATTSVVFSSLGKWSNYSVQVEAFTGVGSGPPSPPVYCTTDEDVPSSPAGIKALVSSPSSITLSWLPPLEPNGQILRYTLYVASVSNISPGKRDGVTRKKTASAHTFKFQFDGLRPGDKYEFRVSASTKIGEGPVVSIEKIQRSNVVASILSFGREWRAIWKTDVHLDCETVGNTSIQWTKLGEAVRPTERIIVGRNGTLLIREVKRDDAGNYTCSLVTGDRLGGEAIIHPLIVQVPPLAPLMTAAGTSFSAINLQWKLSDAGGAPIKGFVLHVKAAEEWVERRLSRRLSTYELQGLECGTFYQMYLTAYNRAGMGRASELVNVSTLGSAPTLKLLSPEFMVQSNATVTRVLLKDVWSGNGCQIRAFRVLYKGDDHSHWQTVNGGEMDGESSTVDLLDLKSSSQYQLRVVAINRAGSQQVQFSVNIPAQAKHSSGNADIAATNVLNQMAGTPFYLDLTLMGPTIVSLVVLVVIGFGACIYYKRKVSENGPSNENLGPGTPTSSLYFKHDPHQQVYPPAHMQHNHPPTLRGPPPSQMYMTVKKATPMKGVDRTETDTSPAYADEVYSYATFEVNEPPQRESRACNNMSMTSHCSSLGQHFHSHRQPSDGNDSDEPDSYESDSEYEDEPIPPTHPQQQLHHKNRLISNLAGSPAGLPATAQKFGDYESHARCVNRYEFVLPSQRVLPGTIKTGEVGVHLVNRGRGLPPAARGEPTRKYSEGDSMDKLEDDTIHGRITTGPYAFNDSCPTAVIQDRRATGRKKSGRRKFHRSNMEAYVAREELPPGNLTLQPPEGFMDTLRQGEKVGGDCPCKRGATPTEGNTAPGFKGMKGKHPQPPGGKSGRGERGNEYAIAV